MCQSASLHCEVHAHLIFRAAPCLTRSLFTLNGTASRAEVRRFHDDPVHARTVRARAR